MSNGITKEELHAFVESNTKLAVALEKLVGNQTLIINKTEELLGKFSNGITSDMREVKNAVCGTDVSTGMAKKIGIMDQNAHDIKIVVSMVGTAIVVCVAVMQFLNWSVRKADLVKTVEQVVVALDEVKQGKPRTQAIEDITGRDIK